MEVHRTQRLSQSIPRRGAFAAVLAVLGILCCGATSSAAPQRPLDALSRARLLYNQQQYDLAIATAELAARQAAFADRARLVLARAHLERFRQAADQADLDTARTVLSSLRPASLPAPERLEYIVGLGEALYLDGAFGAAARLFADGLAMSGPAGPRESALEWWATSLDRLAQGSPEADRPAVYARISDRMQEELDADRAPGVASYWLAAAARGEGNLEAAWHAAIAGWVRALLLPEGPVILRADLDTLVQTAIIPERARAVPAEDRALAIEAMKEEWERVKGNWK